MSYVYKVYNVKFQMVFFPSVNKQKKTPKSQNQQQKPNKTQTKQTKKLERKWKRGLVSPIKLEC